MLKCSSCGFANNDNSRFCMECGAALEAHEACAVTEAEEIPAKPSCTVRDGEVQEIGGFKFRPVPDKEIRDLINKKAPLAEKVLLTVACAAVIIGLTVMVCAVRGEQKPVKMELITNSENRKTVFLCDGKPVDGSVKGIISACESSADGSAYFIINEEGELYSASKYGVFRICKDSEYAVISKNGRYIFYTDKDSDGYLYNVKKDKSEKIASEVDIHTAVFSPDGETIVFNKTESDNLYLYDGRDCEKIDSEATCIAVSDNAERLYAVSYMAEPAQPVKPNPDDYKEYEDYSKAFEEYSNEYDEYMKAYNEYMAEIREYNDTMVTLYYYPNADADKRTELCEAANRGFYFNSDISRIVFADEDNRTYFCEKDSEPERIARNRIIPVCDADEIRWYVSDDSCVYDRAELLEMNYRSTEEELYYIDRKGEAEEIADDFKGEFSPHFSKNGKKLCYVNNEGELYICGADDGDNSKRLAKDVYAFIPEEDFGAFYVLQNDGKLYYVKKNGDKVRIDKDVSHIAKAPSGGIYYISEGELCFAEKDKSEEIELGSKYECVYVFSRDSYALCVAYNEKKDERVTFVSEKGDKNFDESYKGTP